MSTSIGIVGSDGYTPVYQPDAGWKIKALDEIWRGESGKNKVVVNVDDWVIEKQTGRFFRVTAVNPVTLIPTLESFELSKEVTVEEISTTSSDNYRVYYDRSISPYTLAVDAMVKIHSSTASYARIYRGSFIDPTQVISQRFNNSGEFLGVDIPLDMVAFNSHDNYAIKSIQTCNTKEELTQGDTVTIAVFDSSGKLVHRSTALLEETSFVAQAFAEQKFITNIYMKTAFIYDTNSSEISYPVNLPTSSFSPIGVVQYNDGSSIEYPIDGDKFSLFGLDQFVSTIIGHRVPLVLRYRMSDNEAGTASVAVENQHFINRPYNLIVSSPNTSYNAKLYVYPVWVDQITGYKYQVFLMNLDRNILFDVSHLVALSPNSPAFNPIGYGITQRLTFTLDLSMVSSMFASFLHVQSVDIILRGAASDSSVTTLWEVASQVPTPTPYYGTTVRATVDMATRTKVSFDNDLPTVTDFINKIYKTTNPLFNPITETSAPLPTHVELSHGNEKIVVDINQYDQPAVFTHQIPHLDNVQLTFLRLTSSGYLKLSVATMTVR